MGDIGCEVNLGLSREGTWADGQDEDEESARGRGKWESTAQGTLRWGTDDEGMMWVKHGRGWGITMCERKEGVRQHCKLQMRLGAESF